MPRSPAWPETSRELLQKEKPQDGPNLCAHVFHEKPPEMVCCTKNKEALEKSVARVFVVEF